MAKRARPIPPRLAPVAAALCGILIAPGARADWSVRPALELRETYTDNVALRGDAKPQWVTEINPALLVEHRSRRLTVKSAARLNYFIYGDDRVAGTNRFFRQFDGSAKAEVVEDLLYVDASASLAPRNISPFGPQAGASRYASANQADVATYRLAPSVVHRFGSTANMQLRYTRDRVDSGNSGFGSSDSDGYLFNLSSGSAYRNFGWNVYASRQEVERFRPERQGSTPLDAQRTIAENALASASYSLSRTFALTASAGYDKYDYSALGGKTEGAAWSTGFAWTPNSRTSVKASVGKRFVGSNNSLDAQHRSRRSVWRLAYIEAVNTTRSNFMLPATFDTAALLDRLFIPNIPDPLARQQAVADYMRQTGLPSSLVDNVSFLSNRYFLQKQLTASAGIKLARTNATFSLFRTRSDALTDSETDSVVLGRAVSSLNTNTRQVGGNLTLQYEISPRSDLRFSQSLYQNTSLSAGGRQSLSRAVRLSVNRQMGRNLSSSLELRRISGSSLLSNYAPYRENAVSASLSYQR